MKTLTGVIILMLALMFGASTIVLAADAPAAKVADPVAAACQGKKLGDTVKVGGKDLKCEQRHIAVSDSGSVGDKKPPIKK
jgi:hypothetical protein